MKIAIFGGTFNPIHKAHLAIANAAVHALNLDRLLIVPASSPPHKLNQVMEPFEDRYQMVVLACAGEPHLEASRLEDHEGRSYSITTIERLRKQLHSEDELYFLIGSDAFAEIKTWYRWTDVIREVAFIVVNRPGHAYEVPDGATVFGLKSVEMPFSSSEIRQKLQSGKSVPELPEAVAAYIQRHALYGMPA